jgi:hypothetical protein
MIRAIFIGGLLSGLLDITYAISVYALKGIPAIVILQSVASGVMGRAAYSGGLKAAALGLLLHFTMTIIMAAVFITAQRRIGIIRNHTFALAAFYGVALYYIMNYVVVPLSNAAPGRPPEGLLIWGALAAHVFLVAMPIAWAARTFNR